MRPLRVISIVGARPNFVKIAPFVSQTRSVPGVENILVHTGQHYSVQMSDTFFRDFGLPKPDINLEVGSGSHAWQTAEVMKRLEPVFQEYAPELVVVVGDVNSTLAAAIVAAKLGIPLAHIEAGLRSFDFSMPEEINRKLTDAVSQYLFVTEESGVVNLRAEGVPSDRIFLVGNIMIDSLLRHRKVAAQSDVLRNLQLRTAEGSCVPYAVLTLHRPSNVDEPEELRGILEALESVGRELPVVFPVHPRSKERIEAFGFKKFFRDDTTEVSKKGIHLLEPLGYLDFVCLMDHAKMVLTDSGGIQEETTVLGVPCLTLRENTERPATVDWGTNQLVGKNAERIVDAAFAILRGNYKKGDQPPLWDGRAAERIFQILLGALRPEEKIHLAVDSN